MLKGLRQWAWMVPLTASLMVGEAYLLRGYYGRQPVAPSAPELPSSAVAAADSSEVQAEVVPKPFTALPSAPPFQPRAVSVVDELPEAEPSDSADLAETSPSRTEQVIDSLEHALHEMEQVVSALMGQVNRNMRSNEDTLRRRPRRPVEESMSDVERAVREGRRIIDQRIRQEGIDRHLDTLSRWIYHWPHLQERIVDVNSTLYEYVESLRVTFSDADVNEIRETLLDYWKAWSDRTAAKIHQVKEEDHNER